MSFDINHNDEITISASDLAQLKGERDALLKSLGEMLVCFDDGVGVPHTERVLDDARKLFHEVGGDMVAVMSSAAGLKGA